MTCCCEPCTKRVNCEVSGGVVSCCKCLPFRLCVTIEEYGLEDQAVSKMFELDCSLGLLYSNSITYRDTAIDLTFQYKQDYSDDCVFCLSSTALHSEIGDELCVSLGEYASERRTQCNDPNFAFTVDLSSLIYDSGEATITVTKMPIVSRPVQDTGTNDEAGNCDFQQICLKYVEYGVTTKVFACKNDYDQWVADINGNSVTVSISSTNPTKLEVTGDLGEGSATTVSCPGMMASWELDSGDLYVRGDHRADCIDCLCWAKNVCLLYLNDTTGESLYGGATWVEGSGWTSTLEYEGVNLAFVCNECTGVTTLAIEGYEEYGTEVICPNLEGTITVPDLGGGRGGFSVIVTPAGCNDCPTSAGSIIPTCCPEGVPATLYGTFSDGGGFATCIETFPSITFTWQAVSDGCAETVIDGVGYAYRSDLFSLSDGDHRLFLVPCSGPAVCSGDDAEWVICDSIGGLFDEDTGCSPCGMVDLEFTDDCPSDPASATIKLTVTE